MTACPGQLARALWSAAPCVLFPWPGLVGVSWYTSGPPSLHHPSLPLQTWHPVTLGWAKVSPKDRQEAGHLHRAIRFLRSPSSRHPRMPWFGGERALEQWQVDFCLVSLESERELDPHLLI